MNDLITVALNNLLVASFFALLALAAGRWGRRPALTHSLWLLFFLKLLTPPLLPIPVSWNSPLADAEVAQPRLALAMANIPEEQTPPVDTDQAEIVQEPEHAAIPTEAAEAVAEMPPMPTFERTLNEESLPWKDWLLGLWLAGSLGWLALAATRLWRFRKELRLAQPASEALRRQAAELAAGLQLACPEIALVPGRLSPMLWMFGGKPRLLLPAELLDRLDETQRQALLVHELAHWRRRDHWVRRLELVALGLYWWCPLVWWARRNMQEAEEECCDAWVLWILPGAARSYALALVETLDFMAGVRPALPPAASGIGRVRLLQRRLTMIMRGKTPRALTMGGGIVVLGLAALLLPFMPSWAQSPVPNPGVGAVEPQAGGDDAIQAKRRELERAQRQLAEMQAELQRTRADLERRSRDLEKKSLDLHEMMARLQSEMAATKPKQGDFWKVEENKAVRTTTAVLDADTGRVVRVITSPGTAAQLPPDAEKRLREVERKLDMLIDMMKRQPPATPKAPTPRVPQGAIAPVTPGATPAPSYTYPTLDPATPQPASAAPTLPNPGQPPQPPQPRESRFPLPATR
jgi:bla regulator protein BlaR1